MERARIVAAGWNDRLDESLPQLESALSWCAARGVAVDAFHVDPLRAGWHTPLAPNHFRSGCAPVEALFEAVSRLRTGTSEAVLISGRDDLRTGYSREERHSLTAIFGEQCPLPQAYDELAEAFRERQRWPVERFHGLRNELFENCLRSYQARGGADLPEGRWFQPVTRHFRGVDCANPVVDFQGAILVVGEHLTRKMVPDAAAVEVAGVGFAVASGDGPEHVEELATYHHLREALAQAQGDSGVNVAAAIAQGEALLEAYTCYPVVPLAFLREAGVAQGDVEMESALRRIPLTLTGGLNLARAPWNNPALRALIEMVKALGPGKARTGIVHANGGLGRKQGVAVLRVVS